MKVLVTGITGFCGSFLAEALVARGDDVWGLCRHPERDEHLAAVRDRLQLRPADLAAEPSALQAVLNEFRPDVVFHMAAEASTRASLEHPRETIESNVMATTHLLDAARLLMNGGHRPWKPKKIVLFTSSEMYGLVAPDRIPLTEESPLHPSHPYAVSKACTHYLGRLYATLYQVPAVEARAFNQIGPRQKPGFVLPDFARQIAEIRLGRREPVMRVGNLSDRRDFTDVRDAVRAYLLLAERGLPGEVYHICSGRAVPVQEILDHLIRQAGVPIRTEVDPALLRPSKMPIIQGSYDRIRSLTGWSPSISLETSVKDTLHYWESEVKKS